MPKMMSMNRSPRVAFASQCGCSRRARKDLDRERTGERNTRGPLISRFSFTIDVHEWEMKDLREETVTQALARPIVREIAESDVWDERSEQAQELLA